MNQVLKKKWVPAIIFCFIFFVCGCELGGFNLAVYYVGESFSLTKALKSSFTAIQFASMLIAPLLFGRLANKYQKKRILVIFSAIFTVGAIIISFSPTVYLYALGIVFVGTGFSMITSISFSFIMDVYPISNTRINAITQTMFSVGAVLTPIVCGNMFNSTGSNWRIIFIFVAIIASINTLLIFIGNFTFRESLIIRSEKKISIAFPLILVLLISFVAFFYEGAETGLSNYIGTFMTDDLSSKQHLATLSISLFWAFMIPARILTATFHKQKKYILFICLTGIALSIFLISISTSSFSVLFLISMAGFFCGPVYPLLSSFATEVSKSNTIRGVVYLSVIGSLGGALGTFFMGPISELFGQLKYSFLMLVILTIIGLIVYMAFLKQKNKTKYNGEFK